VARKREKKKKEMNNMKAKKKGEFERIQLVLSKIVVGDATQEQKCKHWNGIGSKQRSNLRGAQTELRFFLNQHKKKKN
jgi:hypothetical protein